MAKKKHGIGFAERTCITHPFRLAFGNLWEAKRRTNKQGKETGDPQFSITMVFPEDTDLGKPAVGTEFSLKRIIKNAKIEKWGPDKEDWPEFEHPTLRKGSEKPDWDGFEDTMFAKAIAKDSEVINIFDADGERTNRKTDFYNGCWCQAEILACAYENESNGVMLKLKSIRFVDDGEPMGGGGNRSADEIFGASIGKKKKKEDDDDSDDDTPPKKSKKKPKDDDDDDTYVPPKKSKKPKDDDDDDDTPPPKKSKKRSAIDDDDD